MKEDGEIRVYHKVLKIIKTIFKGSTLSKLLNNTKGHSGRFLIKIENH